MTLLRRLAFVLCLACVPLTGCGPTSDDSGTAEPVSPMRAITSGIAGLGTDLYNSNWVGTTCGKVDKATTCPGGGTVTITGFFSCSTSSTGVQALNLDFTYVMVDCIEVRNNLTLTLNGTMKHAGTSTNVATIVTSESITYVSSSPVKIVATGSPYKSFNDSCEFSLISRQAERGGPSRVTGTLCGESFSLTPSN